MAPAAAGVGRGLNQPVRLAGSGQRWLELERLVGRTNLQMGQNPIRNPTNPFPPYKSSPPNPIQHNPNYTKPLYNFKPNQIKLFDSPWIQPIRIHFSIHGFCAWLPCSIFCSIFWTYWLLVSFSELIVFRALSSARWDMDQRSFSLASLDETEKTWESTSMKLFILAEDGNTWLSWCFSLASSNIALRTEDLTPCKRGNTWSS